jgi:hypothetical protein
MEIARAGEEAVKSSVLVGDSIINIEILSQAIKENIQVFEYFLKEKKFDIVFSETSKNVVSLIDDIFLKAFISNESQYEKAISLLLFIVDMGDRNAAIREFFARISSPQLLLCKMAEMVNNDTLDITNQGDGDLLINSLSGDADISSELFRQHGDLFYNAEDEVYSEEFDSAEIRVLRYYNEKDSILEYDTFVIDQEFPDDFRLLLQDLSGSTKPDAEIVAKFEAGRATAHAAKVYNKQNIYQCFDYKLKRMRSISLGQISDAASYEYFLSSSISPSGVEDSYESIVRRTVARYRFDDEVAKKMISDLTSVRPFALGSSAHRAFCGIVSRYCVIGNSSAEMSAEEIGRKKNLEKSFLYGLAGDAVFNHQIIFRFIEGKTIVLLSVIPMPDGRDESVVMPIRILPDILLKKFEGLKFSIPKATPNVLNLVIEDHALAEKKGFQHFGQWLEDAGIKFLQAKRAVARGEPVKTTMLATKQELNSALIALKGLFPKEAKLIPMAYVAIDPAKLININDKELARQLSERNFGKAIGFAGGKMKLIANPDIIEGVAELSEFLLEYKKATVAIPSAGAGSASSRPAAQDRVVSESVVAAKPDLTPAAENLRKQSIELMRQKKDAEKREKDRLTQLESERVREENAQQKSLLLRLKTKLAECGIESVFPKSGSIVNVVDSNLIRTLRSESFSSDLFDIGKSNASFRITKKKLSEESVLQFEALDYKQPKRRPATFAVESVDGGGSGSAAGVDLAAVAHDAGFAKEMEDLIKKQNTTLEGRIGNISQTMDFFIAKSVALGNLYLQGSNIWMKDDYRSPKDVDFQLLLYKENKKYVTAGKIDADWLVENIFDNKISASDIGYIRPIYNNLATRDKIIAYSIKYRDTLDLTIATPEYELMPDSWVSSDDALRYCFNARDFEYKKSFRDFGVSKGLRIANDIAPNYLRLIYQHLDLFGSREGLANTQIFQVAVANFYNDYCACGKNLEPLLTKINYFMSDHKIEGIEKDRFTQGFYNVVASCRDKEIFRKNRDLLFGEGKLFPILPSPEITKASFASLSSGLTP